LRGSGGTGAIGRSSAPWTSVVTVAFHQDGLFRLPPVSVPAPTIAEWIAAPTSIDVVVVADAASSSATVSETG
jgi:hypothetical protein